MSEKQSVYERVTNQIVEAIEKGAGTWRMPWHTSGSYAFSPVNVASHKPYRGINALALFATAQAKGYQSGVWGTYQQWQDRKAQVRKGEKATTVVFWKFVDASESESEPDEKREKLAFARGYSVFNAAQVDGYMPKVEAQPSIENRIESAEQFFSRIDARVVHGGNQAFYSRATDEITLPKFSAFNTPLDYYSTRAHETAHWTSSPDRCNRELGKRFGDNAYAMEELVAELSAAFTMAQLGLSSEPRPDHAQYIESWLRVLKADTKAIFTAASKAQQATDFLVAHQEVQAAA